MSPTERQRAGIGCLGGREGNTHLLVSVFTVPVFTVSQAFTIPGPSNFQVFTSHSEPVVKCVFDSAVGFEARIPTKLPGILILKVQGLRSETQSMVTLV